MHALKQAIDAAGKELRDEHGWSLDDDDDQPASETLFGRIVAKHLQPLMDPASIEATRLARIAALQAELLALQGT